MDDSEVSLLGDMKTLGYLFMFACSIVCCVLSCL